jgi:hypothetical protein
VITIYNSIQVEELYIFDRDRERERGGKRDLGRSGE